MGGSMKKLPFPANFISLNFSIGSPKIYNRRVNRPYCLFMALSRR
jgi:hypothetical protein